MVKGLQKVTRMSVYFGEYKKTRKSGVNNWCKVVMQVSPVATDPFDGSVYVQTAVVAFLPYWLPDTAVNDMVLFAKENGKLFTDADSKSTGYELDSSHIPQQFRYAFTELGFSLNWEMVDFGTIKYKVDGDGQYIRGKDGKRIKTDCINVAYWSGGDSVISGLTISKEYCMKRALAEWKEGTTSAPVITKEDEPTQEVQQEVES